MKAVEQAILKKQLKKIKVPNGTYEVMSNGNLCIGTYNRISNSCLGNELEVDVINPPKSGYITIENNLTTDYTITLDNDQIVTNIKEVDANCFEYMNNYVVNEDYTINSNACINMFGTMADNLLEEGAGNTICSGSQLYGDLLIIVNYMGYSPQELETIGVISIDDNSKNGNGTIAITEYKCGLNEKDVVIPSKIDGKTVTKIGVGAFVPIDLQTKEQVDEKIINSVVIPNTVKTIEFGAFFKNQLTSVTIPDSVQTIGEWAFNANQLTNLTIGDSVQTIGNYAFGGGTYTDSETGIKYGPNKLQNVYINRSSSDVT